MLEDAFIALDAIHRGGAMNGLDEWVRAFKTIKWVVITEAGVSLTSAGREAYNQMAREQSERSAHPAARAQAIAEL